MHHSINKSTMLGYVIGTASTMSLDNWTQALCATACASYWVWDDQLEEACTACAKCPDIIWC